MRQALFVSRHQSMHLSLQQLVCYQVTN